MKKKSTFTVDEKNRLMIKQGSKSILPKGEFSVDKANKLIFRLNEPQAFRREYGLAGIIRFNGEWKLNKNHDLVFNLQDENRTKGGKNLIFKGDIVSTDKDEFLFEMKCLDETGLLHVRLLRLAGNWQADQYNRLSFTVKKAISPDTLLLENSWQVNKNQEIIYTYEKTNLKTKSRSSQTVCFSGFWKVNNSNRISYKLSGGSNSQFEFSARIESPTIYPKDKEIKYRLGIGVKNSKQFDCRVISLFGTWKFGKGCTLAFAMDYGNGRVILNEFGASIYVSRNNEATFSLANRNKEPLGINIIFTHKFIRDNNAQSFLKFKQRKGAPAFEAGMRLPF